VIIAAEPDGGAGIEVNSDDIQFLFQVGEIIRPAAGFENPHQESVDRLVVKYSAGNGLSQRPHQACHAGVQRVLDDINEAVGNHTGYLPGPLQVLAIGRFQQFFGFKQVFGMIVTGENPAHVGGGDVIGKARRDKRAGADTHIDVQVVQSQAPDGLIHGSQCAQFVNRANRPATGYRQADAGCVDSSLFFRRM